MRRAFGLAVPPSSKPCSVENCFNGCDRFRPLTICARLILSVRLCCGLEDGRLDEIPRATRRMLGKPPTDPVPLISMGPSPLQANVARAWLRYG